MMIDGCEARHATPVLEERVCPDCGGIVEVFTKKVRIVSDSTCDCGFTFRAEEQVFTRQTHSKA